MTYVRKKVPFWNGMREDYLVPKSATPVQRSREIELNCPPRLCSRCGKEFQPTIRRRMLCLQCFNYARDLGI